MTATATLSDWLEILGLADPFSRLLAGAERFSAIRVTIAAARDVYPDVSQDYIAVLDLASELVDEAERIAAQQAAAVAEFNASVMDAGYFFAYDSDRLLSEADREEMAGIAQRIADDLEDLMSEIEGIEDEIEELENEIEALENDSAWDDLESAEDDLEAAADDLEEAAQALEEYE